MRTAEVSLLFEGFNSRPGFSDYRLLLEVEQRLCFYYRYLVGIRGESVNVKLGFSRLKIDVAEWLHAVYLKLRETDKHAAVSAESFEVGEALTIQGRRQTLDLEVGHIADVFAQRTFVRAGSVELESLNQPSLGQHLGRRTDDLGKTYVAREGADDMSAAGDPDKGFVLLAFEPSAGVNIEQFRV
jgi:hypothetical protein